MTKKLKGELMERRHEVLVEDVMNTRVVTVPDSISINEATRVMRRNGVGCVVVKRNSDVLGIVTERDVIRTIGSGESESSAVSILASKPVVVIGPKDSVTDAARILADKGIKRLPVVDGKELVGILTSTDLVEFYEKLSKHMIKTIGP